jgi:DNA replication and repair protein RecF
LLRSVSSRSFRNLADATWSPSAGSNLIFGLNGAGKSSLLEAVYLAATTRSFRTSRLQECLTGGGEAFHVAAEVERDGRSRIELSHDSSGKWRAVNGASGPIAEHLEVLPVVSWTTRDAEIFRGPPAMRRGFIDRGLISERATALSAFTEYRRALEAKRAALERQPEALVEWNAVLAAKGAVVIAMRAEWCSRMQVALDDVLAKSELNFPEVRLTYRPSPAEAVEGEEGFVAALERVASRERAMRRVLIGPQRDDLAIEWPMGRVGALASAGERKLLGLALLLAHGSLVAERGNAPLFLIDDLDAELDRGRVEQVWKLLSEVSQLLATSSRKGVVSSLESDSKWRLEKGVLEPY